MFKYNLGPKYAHIPDNFVSSTLESIMTNDTIEKHLSQDLQKLFINKIKDIIEYIKISKFFENRTGISQNDIIDRCDLLICRSNEGIMPLIVKKEKLKIEDIENKDNFKTTRAKLKDKNYRKKILDLPIYGYNTPEERMDFLHFDDNEYADFLAGRALFFIFLSLYYTLEGKESEKIFEFTDIARRIYDEFFVQYQGIENALRAAEAKRVEGNRVSEIFKLLADDFNEKGQKYKILWDYKKDKLKSNSEIVMIIKEKYEEKYRKQIIRSNKWIEERINRKLLNDRGAKIPQ